MKLLAAIMYYLGGAIMVVLFLPLLLVAIILGFGSYLINRIKTFGLGLR